MELLHLIIAALAFICFLQWGQVNKWKLDAFQWRKRWIIERFGAGVEGVEGNYFVISEYTTGVPCFVFAKNRKDLEMHKTTIRHWDHNIGRNRLSEHCDVPDEKAVGLPENHLRDKREWVASGPGLCRLPPSLHEKAAAMKRADVTS